MTVEEKRSALSKHCGSFGVECAGCVLENIPGARLGGCHAEASDEEIERNYEMVFGPNCEKKENLVTLGDDVDNPPEKVTELIESLKESIVPDPIKPTYYNDTKITPFDVIDDWGLNFYLGNAVKYIKRAGKKADNSRLQDLKKIREYIDHEIRAEEGER